MRALAMSDGDRDLRFVDAPEPPVGDGDVLVAVRAVSINRGELHRLDTGPTDWRPGWDFAGEVVAVASDVDGLEPGARVFGTVPAGAWAERVAAPAGYVARLPEQLSWEQGAALPVAGVTAMRVLALGAGPIAGSRVLVTGAAGGVGRMAVQLAAGAGASVTALVGSPDREHGLTELGAGTVTVGIDAVAGPFDLILESVGGDSLARALSLVADGGVVVTYGNSARAATRFRSEDFYYREARLQGYHFWVDLERDAPAADLATLAAMVRDGRLRLDIGDLDGWEAIADVVQRLRTREVRGKAVLLVGEDR